MNRPIPSAVFMVLFTLLASAPAVRAADEPAAAVATATIPAAEAMSHVGEECVVEFVVENGRKLDDKGVCFLNSLKDHREKGNFTAVIFRDALARFAADGVADPADEFMGKTIRVSGLVAERSGQAQIVVASPTQIEVVEAADSVSPDAQDR